MEHTFSQETQLLARARLGDRRAFDGLFALHQDRVRIGVRGLLDGDQELVEEAVGQVFLRAFLSFPQFQRRAAFSTWLFRIAIREAQVLRKKERKAQHLAALLTDEREQPSLFREDPAHLYMKIDEEHRIRRALLALPEPYRTPLQLRYIEMLTSVEIARYLHRPEGTVRYQISRGLQILRERFIAIT